MSFYEQTIVTKQDLSAPEVEKVESKYADIISGASGKVLQRC